MYKNAGLQRNGKAINKRLVRKDHGGSRSKYGRRKSLNGASKRRSITLKKKT